jgi:hypothetical protein
MWIRDPNGKVTLDHKIDACRGLQNQPAWDNVSIFSFNLVQRETSGHFFNGQFDAVNNRQRQMPVNPKQHPFLQDLLQPFPTALQRGGTGVNPIAFRDSP